SDEQYREGVADVQRAVVHDPPAIFLAWSRRARAVSRRFEVPAEPNTDVLATLRLWRPVTPQPLPDPLPHGQVCHGEFATSRRGSPCCSVSRPSRPCSRTACCRSDRCDRERAHRWWRETATSRPARLRRWGGTSGRTRTC